MAKTNAQKFAEEHAEQIVDYLSNDQSCPETFDIDGLMDDPDCDDCDVCWQKALEGKYGKEEVDGQLQMEQLPSEPVGMPGTSEEVWSS
jgi:hypothetical protein